MADKRVFDDGFIESGFSNASGNCMLAKRTAAGDGYLIKDSKLGDKSPVLEFRHDEVVAFIAGFANGDFA